MGLDTTATHVIWLIAIAGVATALVDDAFETSERVGEARDARQEVLAERLETHLRGASFCYEAATQQVEVQAVNRGTTYLDTSELTFIFDGVAYTEYTVTLTGVSQNGFWAPGETATFHVTAVASAPATGALVTERGVFRDLEALPCLRVVHVDAMATYNGGVASTTFRKRDVVETRVTIRDADGLVVQGATVAIELIDPNGITQFTGSATTDASGVASISYTIPSSATFGRWTDRVTSVSGTALTYDPAANVVSQVQFDVVN